MGGPKSFNRTESDPDIKKEIVEAVEKLFTKWQALYLADVEPERLVQFIDKPVQHFLPW